MKNRKLLILHTECVSLRGGEKYLYETIKRLPKSLRVILCLETVSPYWNKRFSARGIAVFHLWKPLFGYWFFLPLTVLVNCYRLKEVVDDHTVVLATNFPLNFLAVLLSKKTVVFCFEPLSIFYDRVRICTMSFRAKILLIMARMCYQWFDAYAIRRASVLATLNAHVALYIKNRYKRTPDVYLPNGVDHKIFFPINNRASHNHLILLHSTDYTILKGTELLIRSLRKVVQQYPNIEVRISESVNNSVEKEKYLALVNSLHLKKVVRFMGTISENQLPSFYQSGDVFCYLGSPYCGGGSTASLSVIEAQACGIPVLRSLGGDQEIVNSKTGYYIHDYSEKGIAKAILRFLLLSNSKRRSLSKGARQHAVKQFSWDKTADTLSKAVQKIYYA